MKFDKLPDDNFGALVQNEKDERKLLWLVNQIGEKKLRASAAKRNKHYPDAKLYVSVLLKRFQLKVPSHVFAPVKVKDFAVYVLLLNDGSAVKVGFTSDWPGRAFAFLKEEQALGDLFDVGRSLAFFYDSKARCLRAEALVKTLHAGGRVSSPFERDLIPYGCFGHTEWFDASLYETLIQTILSAAGASTSRRPISLAEGVEHALLLWAPSIVSVMH